jgi:hypothetical protein
MAPPSLADIAKVLDPQGDAAPAKVTGQLPASLDSSWNGSVTGRLQTIAARVGAEDVTVTFGGHFNCGKTTLINALIGRPLLPTSDYPETGVPCRITFGAQDRAVALTRDGTLGLSVDTNAIARMVSLIGSDGDYRQHIEDVQRLEITLAGGALPTGLALIDSPGINEIAKMTERATAVARDADILIWVLNSKQPVSESEQAFLRTQLEDRSSGSLVLVVNAFLPADTAKCWTWFLAERAPPLRCRLDSALGLWDGPDAERPAVLVVSARAATGDPSRFGAPAVRQLITGFTLHSPRVRATRLTRAETDLRALIAELDDRVADERTRLDQAQATRSNQRQAAGRRRQQFERTLARDIAAAFARHGAAAQDCANEVTAGIGSQPLQRDGNYGGLLTRGLQEITDKLATEILAATGRSAKRFEMTPPSKNAARRVRELLAPGDAAIAVPDTPVGKALPRGLGAAVGGVLGSFIVPGPGTGIGVALGGVLGGAAGNRRAARAMARDRMAAQGNAIAAGQAAITALISQQAPVERILRAACQPTEPLEAAPDGTRLKQFMSLRNRLRDQQLRQLSQAASAARNEVGQ